jgi:uncharacterized protein YndB with AHSA1/START domain
MARMEVISEPGKQEIVMTRIFNASPDNVFRAHTDKEIVPRWWLGPASSRFTVRVEELEPRWGGRWRFVQRDPEGNEHAFRGVYHEVGTKRIVQTFEYEGMPGHVLMETLTFEDLGGKTRVTAHSVFQSPADRDGMAQAGMEEGARDTWDRLEEVLATM